MSKNDYVDDVHVRDSLVSAARSASARRRARYIPYTYIAGVGTVADGISIAMPKALERMQDRLLLQQWSMVDPDSYLSAMRRMEAMRQLGAGDEDICAMMREESLASRQGNRLGYSAAREYQKTIGDVLSNNYIAIRQGKPHARAYAIGYWLGMQLFDTSGAHRIYGFTGQGSTLPFRSLRSGIGAVRDTLSGAAADARDATADDEWATVRAREREDLLAGEDPRRDPRYVAARWRAAGIVMTEAFTGNRAGSVSDEVYARARTSFVDECRAVAQSGLSDDELMRANEALSRASQGPGGVPGRAGAARSFDDQCRAWRALTKDTAALPAVTPCACVEWTPNPMADWCGGRETGDALALTADDVDAVGATLPRPVHPAADRAATRLLAVVAGDGCDDPVIRRQYEDVTRGTGEPYRAWIDAVGTSVDRTPLPQGTAGVLSALTGHSFAEGSLASDMLRALSGDVLAAGGVDGWRDTLSDDAKASLADAGRLRTQTASLAAAADRSAVSGRPEAVVQIDDGEALRRYEVQRAHGIGYVAHPDSSVRQADAQWRPSDDYADEAGATDDADEVDEDAVDEDEGFEC